MKDSKKQHDAFLMGYLGGKTAKDAYEATYDSHGLCIKKNAFRLKRQQSKRLAELQAQVADAIATGVPKPDRPTLFDEDNAKAEKAIMDAVDVQKRLTDIIRMAVKEDVVLKNGDIVVKRPSITDVIRAADLLGKYQGAYVSKQEIDVRGAVPIMIRDDVEE